MIKCQATEQFTLKKFSKLKNIVRKNEENNEKGKIYYGDIFECDDIMANYLLGKNDSNKCVIKVIEIIPRKSGKDE